MKYIIVVFTLILEFILASLIVPKSLIDWASAMENRWASAWYGLETWRFIIDWSRTIFDRLFVRSGIVDFTYFLFLPTQEEWDRAGSFAHIEDSLHIFEFLENRLDVFWMEIQQDIQRFIQLGTWLIVLGFFGIFLVLDGLSMRSLRSSTFGYQSPFIHRYSLLITGWIWAIVTVLIILPIPVPPQLFPIVIITQSILLNMIAANIQKKI